MEQQPKDNRKVFVAYGRNIEMKKAMFEFLKALDLFPQDWKELVASTGKGSPYVGDVLDKAFSDAQAIVILLTPDDEGRMNYNFLSDRDPPHERSLTPQARQNVIFEAGIAMGYRPDRTIIVQIGNIRPFSDIGGRHTIIMDNSEDKRGDLAKRLNTAGCPTNTFGSEWLKAGNFDLNASKPPYSGLKDPLEKYYKTIERWLYQIKKSRVNKANPEVPTNTKYHITQAITAYCEFLKMTPDEIIADAKREMQLSNSIDKHNEFLDEFIKNLSEKAVKNNRGITKARNFLNNLIAFYKHNGVTITTHRLRLPEARRIKSLRTEEIQKIYKNATLEHGSWILANSYMGLPMRQIIKLKVEDFNVENWKEDKPIYPVRIRHEISDVPEYTTFIGADAKKVLEYYFALKNFKSKDQPWNFTYQTPTWEFKRLAYKAGIIDAPNGLKDGVPKGFFPIAPKSFEHRINSTLESCNVPPSWRKILTGHVVENSRPNQEQLYEAYLSAIQKLQVFKDLNHLNLPTTLTNYTNDKLK